jgi:hypothetical protein
MKVKKSTSLDENETKGKESKVESNTGKRRKGERLRGILR